MLSDNDTKSGNKDIIPQNCYPEGKPVPLYHSMDVRERTKNIKSSCYLVT